MGYFSIVFENITTPIDNYVHQQADLKLKLQVDPEDINLNFGFTREHPLYYEITTQIAPVIFDKLTTKLECYYFSTIWSPLFWMDKYMIEFLLGSVYDDLIPEYPLWYEDLHLYSKVEDLQSIIKLLQNKYGDEMVIDGKISYT